ncbi:MAG TPA: phosphoribosylanthranilate isomerase [Armatimonadota bacterium]
MPTPWLKVCGLRRPEDLLRAQAAGARYLGLIVEIPRSPRCVTLPEATALAALAPGQIVAVVADLPEERLAALVAALHPAALQLHGAETPAEVACLRVCFPGLELWKGVGLPVEAKQARAYAEAGATALLVDTRTAAGLGGSGVACDWAAAAALVAAGPLPVILAGGLNPENLEEAARQVCPAGLDVSSGVEQAPGVKSEERLTALGEAWGRLVSL